MAATPPRSEDDPIVPVGSDSPATDVPASDVPVAERDVTADGAVPPPSTVPAVPVPAPGAASPSRVRSGAVPFLLGAAAVVVVIVLAGGTSWVVARAAAAEPLPVPTATDAPHRAGPATHGDRAGRIGVVRGTVRDIGDRTWTIATAGGESVTVTIGEKTRFVRDGSAVSASSFHVGDAVVVAGTRSGTTVEARRIAVPGPRPSASPTAGA